MCKRVKDAFAEKVKEASKIKYLEEAKNIQKQLKRSQKRCDELNGIIKTLYESFATGKIPEKRFSLLSAEYEAEQEQLELTIEDLQSQMRVYEEDTERIKKFIAVAEKYTDFSVLTTPMINEFIDKIIVHAPEKIDGERTQEIEVYLKFIGKFDIPALELTPDEEKEAEKIRLRRKRAREYYHMRKSKELAKKEQQETADESKFA